MRGIWMFVIALAASGCGVRDPLRLEQPLFVATAVFREGPLPGSPPLPDGETPPDGVPSITAIEVASGVLIEGQLDRRLTGRTSEDAYAIALRFDELGSGYFTLPVGASDPAFAGERDYDVDFDVGSRLPSGLAHLCVVAIDSAGRAGPQRCLEVCVIDGAIPDDVSVCDPSIPPPAAAVVVRWDADADLDLVVTTPDGDRVDARHPLTTSATDPTVGRFLRDSNAGCVIDGRNEETLEWREPPVGAGAFLVGVDLFAACGTSAVRFEVTILRRETRDDGSSVLAVTERSSGELLALQADAGRRPPLYVTNVAF